MINWLLHALKLPDFLEAWLSGVVGAITFYILAVLSGRIRDFYISLRYPIAGEYLTHFEDLKDGKKVLHVAPARLKQRGFAIWGETKLSPQTSWRMEGRLQKGGHFYGVYTALSPHDSGVGNFFLKVNQDRDMDGIWSGYDNENKIINAGLYQFRRMQNIVIKALTPRHEAAALDLASRVLGNDYVSMTVTALNSNGREGIFFDVALSPDNVVAGFVLGKLLQRGELPTLLKGFTVRFPADLEYADSGGKLGVLQSVGVEPKYQMRGIGTLLIRSAMKGLHERGAETLFSIAWKAPDGIHAHAVLTHMGFVPFGTVEHFWRDESKQQGYSCPSCGNPCQCAAVLYKCSNLKR